MLNGRTTYCPTWTLSNPVADLDHLAQVLVAEPAAGLEVGPPLVHVQVRAAETPAPMVVRRHHRSQRADGGAGIGRHAHTGPSPAARAGNRSLYRWSVRTRPQATEVRDEATATSLRAREGRAAASSP